MYQSVEDESYHMLAAAIVKQAVDDYVFVLKRMWTGKVRDTDGRRKLAAQKISLEAFFHSPWYEMLSEIDGERLMTECRRFAREQAEESIRRANRKAARKLLKTGK